MINSGFIDRFAFQDAEKFADDDRKAKKWIDARNDFENYANSPKTQIAAGGKFAGKLSSHEKKTIEKLAEEKIRWQEKNRDSDVEIVKRQKNEVGQIFGPIVNKLHQGDEGVWGDHKKEL